MFGPGSSVRVIGHRGAAAVAPENTLPSFRHAVEIGAHGVELDLQCSRDGRLMVIHDPTVDRTTDGTGRVEEMDFQALRRLDAGHAFSLDGGNTHPFRDRGVFIPTLEEVLDAVRPLPVVAEVKSRRAGKALGEWLRSGIAPATAARDRLLVGGFDAEEVDPARREARWGCAYQSELLPYVLLGKIGLGRFFVPHTDAAMVPEKHRGIRIVSRGFVRRCHRDGLGVFVWTVNRPDDARRLLSWGVDGVLSDAPGRALRVVREAEVAPRPDTSTGQEESGGQEASRGGQTSPAAGKAAPRREASPGE